MDAPALTPDAARSLARALDKAGVRRECGEYTAYAQYVFAITGETLPTYDALIASLAVAGSPTDT